MQPLNNILVALDLSTTDEDLVSYVAGFSSLQDIKKVVFVHVARGSDLEEEADWEGEKVPLKEKLSRQIASTVQQNFEFSPNLELVYVVRNGSQLNAILSESRINHIDLIVLGKKALMEGSGQLAKMLTRRALCSVMIVPQKARPKFDKILVPVDFSDHAKLAIERAVGLNLRTGAHLICLHVFSMPEGYYVSGKTKEEFAKIMENNAKKRWKYFLTQTDTQGVEIECKFQADHFGDVQKIVYNVALIEHVDMIVVGSRGMSKIAATFLGDTTEKLLMLNMNIPMLVIKSPEYNLGFFDALLNI